jgi:hypothetical protein
VGKYRHIVALASLVVLVCILFGKTVGHGFNSDDYIVLYHALNRPADTLREGLAEFLKPSWGVYYRPGIKIFFEILAKSFGLWPGAFHAVSLVCYALLCIQVYVLGLLLCERRAAALAAAVIFLTSSVHAEAIFWISSLNGVVENLLVLTSLICFVFWRRSARRLAYPLSLIFFVSALFTKESAVSLPVVLILYDLLLGGDVGWPAAAKRAAKSGWPFVLIGILFIALRSLVMRQADLPPPLTTFEWRIMILGLWYSLIMTLSPIDWALALKWFDRLAAAGTPFYILAACAIIMVAVVPVAVKKFRLTFLIWWILASAAPVMALGLVPSERHVVLGSVGAAILVSIALFRLAERIARRANAASIALASFFVIIYAASGCYFLKQRQAIWRHASEVAGSVVEQTTRSYPAPARDTTFFFLNVPDSIQGALVFRFENLAYALRLAYEDDSVEAVRIVTLDKVPHGSLSSAESAYFKIAAMGRHVYLPEESLQNAQLAARWQRLDELAILRKDSGYLRDWDRYGASPFLAYAGGVLVPSSPEELKAVLRELYSLD